MLFAELLAKSMTSSWMVDSLTQPFPSLSLGRTGLLYLAPLALYSEIIFGKGYNDETDFQPCRRWGVRVFMGLQPML